MQNIYNNNQDHSIHNNWIGLFNYESESSEGINGYLRLSISVLHEMDKKVPLELRDSLLNSTNLLVPSLNSAKIKFEKLCFYIYCVFDIPDMDRSTNNDYFCMLEKKNCKSDTYIEIEYMDIKVKTSTQKLVADYSKYCEVLKIPIIEPRLTNKILIKLFDKDNMTDDDLIGTLEYNLDDLLNVEKNL